jgi:MFS family permease
VEAFGRRRVAPVLAVGLGLVALGACVADVAVPEALRQPAGPGGWVADWLVTSAVALAGTAVGILLAARRPGNPIGWLLLILLLLTASPADGYAIVDYRTHHGTLPLGWVAVLFIGGPLITVLMALLLWLFPDGRLPGGRWHLLAVVLVTAGVAVGIATTVGPGLVAAARHDVHIDAGGNLYPVSPAWTIAANVTNTAAVASLLGWLALQAPRYRRAGAERRQQLKWLYSGAAVFVAVLIVSAVGPYAIGETFGSDGPLVNDSIQVAASVMLVCIAIAVLKYRLYAIDRIISRVISYLIITAVLAGVFAGLVLLATAVLPFQGSVAVAAATLVAAALFNPLRRRVQHAVDRRFNRTRYNAEAVVAAFTSRLRQTVDFDAVQGELLYAVHHAFQPTHVSLGWVQGSSSTLSPTATQPGSTVEP